MYSGLSKQGNPAIHERESPGKCFLEGVRMRCFRQPLAFLFLFIGFSSVAWSQASFTSLRGTISDPSGAVIPGSTVTIVDKATSVTSTQTASGSGEYEFQQIPPGTYVITANGTGFSPQSKQ